MKNKLKETMTTNEKQDEELKVLRAQNKDCATVIKEKVSFFFICELSQKSSNKKNIIMRMICYLIFTRKWKKSRPTSNRAYIGYDHTIYCFQFVRALLKSKREWARIQFYSQTLSFWSRMRVRSIVLKTIDRTALIISTLYWRSALRIQILKVSNDPK